MTDKFLTNYDEFLEKFGLEAQINVAIEEMSELTKELCKFNRFQANNDKVKDIAENIKEEIADVLNMVEQLEFHFGKDEIEKIREEKIKRTIDRMTKGGIN